MSHTGHPKHGDNSETEKLTLPGVVILGGGQAAVQLADSLRYEGYTLPITIVHDEAELPYQRPPLSKELLTQPAQENIADPLPLRGAPFFAENDITLLSNVVATSVDRTHQTVRLSSSQELPYKTLVFATGARNRTLNEVDDSITGVHSLRTFADAQKLSSALNHSQHL